MDRKEFFSKVLVGGSVLFFAPAVFNACSKASDPTPATGGTTIDLTTSAYAPLKTIGGAVYSGNMIIIRSSATSYVALSKICTHQGCTVEYNNAANKLVCPCHGAQFSTSGSVLQGPANNPLTKYTATVNGTILTIS